jgi:hypothetical protein
MKEGQSMRFPDIEAVATLVDMAADTTRAERCTRFAFNDPPK